MQIFPAEMFNQAGGIPSSAKLGSATGKINIFETEPPSFQKTFKDVIDTLTAYHEGNANCVPVTANSGRNERSYFKGGDFAFLKNRLLDAGVTESTVDEYFRNLHTSSFNPTIAEIRSAANKIDKGRINDPLNDEELVEFRELLNKFGLSKEEITFAEFSMHDDNPLAIFTMIQEKLEAQTLKCGHFELNKKEFDLLLKACDVTGEALKNIQENWLGSPMLRAEDETLLLNYKAFGQIFGYHMYELEEKQNDITLLRENLGDAIQAMLENKKAATRA